MAKSSINKAFVVNDKESIDEFAKAIKEAEENEKELIAEQHRLFDLAKEQEEALKIICGKEVGFSQLYYSNNVEDYNNTLYFRFKPSACESMALTQAEFDLVKKVVEKYGK